MTVTRDAVNEARLKVLFVDDDPAVIRAIARVIAAQSGFDVVTAGSGKEALEILGRSSIDILVSDIDMPQMTGLELVRQARREFPTTLRVLLTGAATMDRAVQAINEGEVVRFFSKPFDVGAFTHAFNELRERILMLRRERHIEAQRERCQELFRWIEERFPGTLAIARGESGEVVIDADQLRASLASAPAEVRALAGGK